MHAGLIGMLLVFVVVVGPAVPQHVIFGLATILIVLYLAICLVQIN